MTIPPQAITAEAVDDVALAIATAGPHRNPVVITDWCREAARRALAAAVPHLARCAQPPEPEVLARTIHHAWCDIQGCDKFSEDDRAEAMAFLKVAGLLRQEGGGT